MLTRQDREDIEQEYQLLVLSGVKNPSRRFLQLKLESTYRQEVFFDDLTARYDEPEDAGEHLDFSPLWRDKGKRHHTSETSIQRLLSWTMTQDELVQSRVFSYLAGDLPLSRVLVALQNRGLLEAPPAPEIESAPSAPTVFEHSLKQFLLRRLPATKEELIQAATLVHQTQRPAASVRQFIRRSLKLGEITHDEVTQLYHRTNTH